MKSKSLYLTLKAECGGDEQCVKKRLQTPPRIKEIRQKSLGFEKVVRECV
ncbi:hypothetical protein [Sulfuracidifex tepidarius]|nr:hypothetical protein [Sulfuracidifex tepidarius]